MVSYTKENLVEGTSLVPLLERAIFYQADRTTLLNSRLEGAAPILGSL